MSEAPKAAATARRRAHRRSIVPIYKDNQPTQAQARHIVDLLFLYITDELDASGRKLSDFAKESRVSESSLKKWKSGDRLPTLIDATKCFATLGYVLHPRFIGKGAVKLDKNDPRFELQGFDWIRVADARVPRELNCDHTPAFGSKEWQESEQGKKWIRLNEAEERASRKRTLGRWRVEPSKGPITKTVK